MSWTPTDEQVRNLHAEVVAAHYPVMDRVTSKRGLVENARLCHCGHPLPWAGHDLAMEQHRLHEALVAAGPMIAASALRDAAATQDEESARLREAYRQHNASRDPNRPPRRPDLNVWSNADEATAHRLRARADQIEEEAGR